MRRIICCLIALLLCFSFRMVFANQEYIGESTNGMGGLIQVSVTMDGETIKAIKTLKQQETRGLGTTAILKLTEDIIAGNTTEVDNYSGATISSIAFKCAVRRAVETAMGFNPTAGIVLGENEYLGISENGLGGRILVKVKVQDGTLLSVDVLESHESPEIGEIAMEKLIEQMISDNTTDVDKISGATLSSHAICEAVSQAMNQVGK